MQYILKALQKLSVLDLVLSKAGGCFPRRLVLLSTGVVMVAWAVTGWADMVVVCTWIGGARGVGIVSGAGNVIWDCGDPLTIGDNWSVRLIVVPCNRLWILSWNAHFYLFLPIFCILRNQVTIPSLHVMARKYSHVMVCHMSDCVVLVDQARDESRG